MKCTLPFNTISYTFDGFQTCCYHDIPIEKAESGAEFWNSKSMQSIRNDFLNGEPKGHCKECIRYQELTKDDDYMVSFGYLFETGRDTTDKKIFHEKHVSSEMLQVSTPFAPVIAVLALSNKCNLACRSCTPTFSDTQAHLRKRVGLNAEHARASMEIVKAAKEINSTPSIREVIIVGGEPMIDDKIMEVMTLLRKDLNVRIQTNGTIFKEEALDLLLTFNGGSVCFSQDGPSTLNEYLRTNIKTEVFWEVVLKTITKLWPRQKDFKIGFNQVLSNLSVFGLRELMEEFIKELGDKIWHTEFISVHQILLTYPNHFRVECLDRDMRIKLLRKLQSDMKWAKACYERDGSHHLYLYVQKLCRTVVKILKNFECDENEFKTFIEFNAAYDRMTNKNLDNLIGVYEIK